MSLLRPEPKGSRLGAAIFGSVFLWHFAALAQTSDLGAEAMIQAKLFKQKAFAHCENSPDSYYIGPFPESTLACSHLFGDHSRIAKTCEVVVELHATHPNPVIAQGTSKRSDDPRIPISPAGWENGVRWEGAIRFYYDRSRARYRADGVWLPWDEWRDQRDTDSQPIVVASLIKKNDRWRAANLRTTGRVLSNASVLSITDFFKVASTQFMSEMFGAQGLPTVTLKQLLIDMDQRSCEDLFSNGPRERKDPLHTLTNRSFTGTADGFIAAFPAFLKQATDALGVEEKDYEQERAYIINAVQTCKQITPEMILTSRRVQGPGVYGPPDLSKLGDQYKDCSRYSVVSKELNALNKELDLGIGLRISPVWSNDKVEENGFRIEVEFLRLKDGGIPSNLKNPLIVAGRTYADSVAKQLATVTPLQALSTRKFAGTPAEFTSALPTILNQAFKAMSLDPMQYEKETAYISKSIQTCGQITPDLLHRYATKIKTRNGSLEQLDVRNLGAEYKMCAGHPLNVSDEVKKTYDPEHDRGIMVTAGSNDGSAARGLAARVQTDPFPAAGII